MKIDSRFDDVLRKMLSTPPEKHKDDKKKTKQKPESKKKSA